MKRLLRNLSASLGSQCSEGLVYIHTDFNPQRKRGWKACEAPPQKSVLKGWLDLDEPN